MRKVGEGSADYNFETLEIQQRADGRKVFEEPSIVSAFIDEKTLEVFQVADRRQVGKGRADVEGKTLEACQSAYGRKVGEFPARR